MVVGQAIYPALLNGLSAQLNVNNLTANAMSLLVIRSLIVILLERSIAGACVMGVLITLIVR